MKAESNSKSPCQSAFEILNKVFQVVGMIFPSGIMKYLFIWRVLNIADLTDSIFACSVLFKSKLGPIECFNSKIEVYIKFVDLH